MATATPTDAQQIEAYLHLFLAFRAMPETRRGRTFMEVAGNPHYENVSSNILAFYLDPYAEHGLKDLMIGATLKMANVAEPPILGEQEVVITRECGTDEG